MKTLFLGECDQEKMLFLLVITGVHLPSLRTKQVILAKTTEGKFDLKLILVFDCLASEPSVVEWMEKIELVCKMCQLKYLEPIVPLRLMGGVFAIYQQLKEEKEDFHGMV